MSREISFRGKRKEDGKWIEGYLSSPRTICCTSIWGNVDEIVIDPSTICQYTGQRDREGVRIWENDILLAHGNPAELYRVCFGEFKVYDIDMVEVTDKAVGWYLKVIPTDIISRTKPFNIDLPLNSDWINNLQAFVTGNIFNNSKAKEKGE